MAIRPIFVPIANFPYIKEIPLEFEWHGGFAKSQAQRSIRSLHNVACKTGISPILEISSKSLTPLGERLSAFNLRIQFPDYTCMTVECAFQGSKVFRKGGPYTDLYKVSSLEAKKDERLQKSGDVIGFRILGEDFPISPPTAFYDWLYLNALHQNPDLARQLLGYSGFSDIAFNPKKSINCQARSAALFVALSKNGLLEKAIKSKQEYLLIIAGNDCTSNFSHDQQLELPWDM